MSTDVPPMRSPAEEGLANATLCFLFLDNLDQVGFPPPAPHRDVAGTIVGRDQNHLTARCHIADCLDLLPLIALGDLPAVRAMTVQKIISGCGLLVAYPIGRSST